MPWLWLRVGVVRLCQKCWNTGERPSIGDSDCWKLFHKCLVTSIFRLPKVSIRLRNSVKLNVNDYEGIMAISGESAGVLQTTNLGILGLISRKPAA